MARKQAQRLTEKALRKHCEEQGFEFVSIEGQARAHDKVVVIVWGETITFTVACTPGKCKQQGAKIAVSRLKDKVNQLREAILAGTHTSNAKKR